MDGEEGEEGEEKREGSVLRMKGRGGEEEFGERESEIEGE